MKKKNLTTETLNIHRVIISLIEELEAVDWYNQRVNICDDKELQKILEHNRDEEKEHAAMLIEWIRRQGPSFDKELRDYIFSKKSITEAEAESSCTCYSFPSQQLGIHGHDNG